MQPQNPQQPYQQPVQPQQQPQVSQQTDPQGQYDFIINPNAAPKKAKFIPSSSMPMRILMVLAGLFVLAIVAAVVVSLLGKGGGAANKDAILSVAQDQTEIIRLSTSGVENSVSQTNKNFSATTKLTMTSSQKELLAFASAKNIKINPKQLPAKQSSTIDTQLATAKSASTFDVVYADVMKRELDSYQADLAAAYKTAGTAGKALLLSESKSANLLYTQLTESVN